MGIFSFLFGIKEETSDLNSKGEKRIEDFFKIDLNDIMKYNPTFTHSDVNSVGSEVKHYNLRLKELELGIFYDLEILEVAKGECNIIFHGKSNILTKELSEFLSFYTRKYGLDEMGYGDIEQTDYHYINSHLFSRMWKNLMIDNNSLNGSNGNIEMSVLGLKQNINSTNVINN